MRISRPRAVVFDIGKVLFDNSGDKFVEEIRPYSPLKDTEIYREIFFSPDKLVSRFDSGEISVSEFLSEFKRRLKLDISDEKAAFLWSGGFIYSRVMEDLVDRLKKRDYILWIISNINKLHIEHLEHFYGRLLAKFHGKTYSCDDDVKCLKPHPYIYCYTLTLIRRFWSPGINPEECIFIDDLEENVRETENLDWKGIKHTSVVRTKAMLEEYGVEL